MGENEAPILPLGKRFEYGSLRSLGLDDVEGMLEWMRDPDVAGKFQTDFSSMDVDDALAFIRSSWASADSAHLAIDLGSGYLGTVSLKRVDLVNMTAEYAISTRSVAHGTGAAMEGTLDVLSLAFHVLGLNRVYLNVRVDNSRARAFYRKVGFVEEGIGRQSLRDSPKGFSDLAWFSMLASEFGTDYRSQKSGRLWERRS